MKTLNQVARICRPDGHLEALKTLRHHFSQGHITLWPAEREGIEPDHLPKGPGMPFVLGRNRLIQCALALELLDLGVYPDIAFGSALEFSDRGNSDVFGAGERKPGELYGAIQDRVPLTYLHVARMSNAFYASGVRPQVWGRSFSWHKVISDLHGGEVRSVILVDCNRVMAAIESGLAELEGPT